MQFLPSNTFNSGKSLNHVWVDFITDLFSAFDRAGFVVLNMTWGLYTYPIIEEVLFFTIDVVGETLSDHCYSL